MQVRVELSSRRGERYHMQNQRKQRLRRLSWIVGDRWGRPIIAITKSCLSWATSSWTTFTMPHLSFFFPVQSRSRLLSVTNTKEFVISALAFWRRAEPHQHPGILWMAMAFFLTQVCFKSMLRLVWVALILILLLLNSRVPLSAASISAPPDHTHTHECYSFTSVSASPPSALSLTIKARCHIPRHPQ